MMGFPDMLQVKAVTSENKGTKTTNRKTLWMITDEKSGEGRMITDEVSEIFVFYGQIEKSPKYVVIDQHSEV